MADSFPTKIHRSFIHGRHALLYGFLLYYILVSMLVRIALLFLSDISWATDLLNVVGALLWGLLFDVVVACSFGFLYALYLLLWPKKWIGSVADSVITWIFLTALLFVTLFAFMAEFPFWDEFKSRFNFIAVDYLIYTYEVIQNINESYPVPLILGVLALLGAGIVIFFRRKGWFTETFQSHAGIRQRFIPSLLVLLISAVGLLTLKNTQPEFSENSYINEIGKNGVFSFFSAFKNNELDYKRFYPTLPDNKAIQLTRQHLISPDEQWAHPQNPASITRAAPGTESPKFPNIILVCIESFSAEFLTEFGNTQNLTPNMDRLAGKSIFFSNMFATGTRTVRGMEALTLCVPPTPGNSIVRRQNNDNLFSIATVLREKNYKPYFIYGGDGYFDNMNAFFGGQGFTIIDRNRGNPLPEAIKTERKNIEDAEVTFENAWGICDEDIYRQSLQAADREAAKGQRFFQFIMTTSNHKPYTFPEGEIDLPQGSREAAVKYTDYAIAKFLSEAQRKSWYANTVFVFVADHCASSAGKWEINTEKHHIPAFIFGNGIQPQKIDKLVSQIDLMPTLFGALGWSYQNAFYGRDVMTVPPGEERAFIGNYRTLGMLQNNLFTQINDCRQINQFNFDPKKRTISSAPHLNQSALKDLTVAFYQTASERFSSGKMKADKN